MPVLTNELLTERIGIDQWLLGKKELASHKPNTCSIGAMDGFIDGEKSNIGG
jgi:hypothetical protein